MANVKSLKDMKEENDDEKRQAYYAGGHGQNGGGSGQEVLDPRDFMKRARDEMGAESADEWRANQPSGAAAFSGAGQSLNGTATAGTPGPARAQEHTITFWSNGFTVDDGPLRKVDDPENAAFLRDVNRGQMPSELVGPDGNAESDVHLIDRSGEPYKPPPPTLKPFSGSGRSMRDAPAEGVSPPPPPTSGSELSVDPAQPTTTLQIRLHDGSRKVVKANHTHTVQQLLQHVATLTPNMAFELSTTFPRKKLTEPDKTLVEAELLNQTIVQSAADSAHHLTLLSYHTQPQHQCKGIQLRAL
eukprot:CAMPEP_0119311772 /NCGR_PEP_ID=MMETSP1333-20130426/23818_1 /TAXON_ID=418940 /ORGANISM="Scyphosphaera apsteinii, Strain RCC1455" /LENGTH=300 /DNA_ID=CAMNT_0007316243 /DNA_START=39 /DNA_END=942 /DNA_ORIENTATION=+